MRRAGGTTRGEAGRKTGSETVGRRTGKRRRLDETACDRAKVLVGRPSQLAAALPSGTRGCWDEPCSGHGGGGGAASESPPRKHHHGEQLPSWSSALQGLPQRLVW